MLARYVDSVDEDIPDGTVGFFKAVIVLVANTETASARADGKIDSMLTVDVQYNYSFGEVVFLSDLNIAFGLQTSLMKDFL
jgi:hypothetical protein